VTALDMAASGVHPKQARELNSIVEYAEPLFEFFEGLPRGEKVILVGHSMGGIVISMAMERFPEKIAVAVFVAAVMYGPELSVASVIEEYARRLDSYMDTEYAFDDGPEKPPTTLLFGYNFMASKLYQLSPPEDLTLASYSVRPLRLFLDEPRLKAEEIVMTAKYGSVRRVYIVCDEDLVVKEDLQRWMIDHNPTDEVCVISNSDHMVMFSKPLEYCSTLKQIAENYS
ncbi:AB hydrolase-1 domain-containing protein, partial [Psidium guajava]